MLSGRGGYTLDSVVEASGLTQGKALGDEEVLEVNNFSVTTERVLLIEAVLRDEEFIGETGDPPSGLTVGKDTGLESSRHIL